MGRSLRTGASLGALAVLLTLVAMAGESQAGSAPGAMHPTALRVVGDALLVVFGLMAVTGLVGWFVVLSSRRRRRDQEEELIVEIRVVPWWARLVAVALPLALVGGVVAGVAQTVGDGSGALAETEPTSRNGAQATTDRQAVGGPDWLVIGTVVAAVVVAVAVGVMVTGRRQRSAGTRRAAAAGDRLDEVREVALDELRHEPDPRRAVIRAYAAMAALLGLSGLPRRPSETPFEFLGRALMGLGASAGAAARLTELFERAKFSHHPIGAAVKDEAIAAVAALRTEVAW